MAIATIEIEYSSGTWTDTSADVVLSQGIHWERGIKGDGPLDVIAQPGTLSFALNNTASNSGTQAGYYSPGHGSVRTGFTFGTRVRLKLTQGSTSWYHFLGTIKTISPTPGATSGGLAHCTAVDWMDKFAERNDLRLVLRENYRSDQAISDLVAQIDTAPTAQSLDTGKDTYTFVFDDVGDNLSAVSVAQDICQSERGYLYLRGDASAGETLRFENRLARAVKTTDETLPAGDLKHDGGLVVPSDLSRVVNIVNVAVFPRKADTSNVTLVQLEQSVEVLIGETVEFFTDYKDPDNEAEHVGGKSVVTPVANTDWTADAAADGSGADVTSDFAVSATTLGSRVLLQFTNNGTVTGYVRGTGGATGMKVRGLGLYRYAPIERHSENTTSTALYGERPLRATVEMPYQDDVRVAQDSADFIANLWGGVVNIPLVVRPITSIPSILERCLDRDIGDKIVVSDTQTAVSSAAVFIQAVVGDVRPNGSVQLEWQVAPADTTAVLILNDATAGKLDSNALAYG